MLKNLIWLIALSLSFVLATVSYAQTSKAKPAPRKSAIWGQETNYGVKGKARKPQPKGFSWGATNPPAATTQRKRRPQPQANKADSKPTESLSLNFANRPKRQVRSKR